MRSRNNQILTGSKGVDMQISAPFSCFHAIGNRPMAFFHTRTCPCLKTVSLRVRKPLLFPLRLLQAGGRGCFPLEHIREAKRRLFSWKSTLFKNRKERTFSQKFSDFSLGYLFKWIPIRYNIPINLTIQHHARCRHENER